VPGHSKWVLASMLFCGVAVAVWFLTRDDLTRPPAEPPLAVDGQKTASPTSLRLYPIRLNGKMGYMNRACQVVIKPDFDNAWVMTEGYGNILVGGKRGLVDQDGRMVIQPQYYFAGGLEMVQEGVVCFMNDKGRHGFLDPLGNEAIPPRFQYALGFSEGLAPAMVVDGKFGFIDRTGEFVIRPAFDNAWPFSEGFACVQARGEIGFIDRTGAFVFGRRFGYAYGFSDGLAAINVGGRPPTDPRDEIGGKWGFIDRTGRVVIEPQFDHAWDFHEGRAGFNRGGYSSGKWGFIDKAGRIVVEPKYSWVEEFSEGLAAVAADPFLFGYIDQNGRVLIEPQFKSAGPYTEGLAEVGVGSPTELRKYGYINREGQYVWKPTR
jgi:hypothetical protein